MQNTTYQATQTGNGAIAQGNGATAVGAGGVVVGNNSGNVNTGTQHFSGGTVVFGGVDTGGGDFVGRDKITYGIQSSDLTQLFAPLLAAAQQAPADKQAAAVQQVEALKAEVAKGDKAGDTVMATIIKGLVALVPAAIGTVVSVFASPILGGLAKPVTEYVLKEIKETMG